ncbi:hypothetical protein KR52_04950 [Synechococcus sp. KORDI-52]|uniref:PAP/fibrillin family protein n=1 Tax=Synechococcus sp. KORDI-52 TaxID=585425 RepID=UPI0004E068AA|nr:PAP/fibrillin family protein [Synechococcus sp. KORDI-52]AII48493.1 hypothetical protein KR52_04950 [Synechococcus sp. KORDI-52]
MGYHRNQLVNLLRARPSDPELHGLVNRVELENPTDLSSSAGLLRGVWELRWSSSRQPWLKQTAGLENLQILDPEQGRGCNLLRLRGPFSALGGISVQADLEIADSKRVEVRFRQGGWMGPSLPNRHPLSLMRQVQQSTPAWLDITVLDEQLRICRGNAGTTFALLRRNDLNLLDLLGR